MNYQNVNQFHLLPENFDKSIINKVAVHPLQSYEWGEARKKMGLTVLRVGEFTKNIDTPESLINIFQFSVHNVPFTPYKIGYLPRSSTPSHAAINFLTKIAQQYKLIFLKIEPCEKKESVEKSYPHNLLISPHPLFPKWTQILNLTPPVENLLKNMKPKTRYNINLATKKGVIIKEVADDVGFSDFARLYFETCKRQKYHGHDLAYHKTVWNTLKDSIAHLMIAYYNNIPLAAYELFYFNKTMYYTYGGTSNEFRNFMPSNLLMWESILLAKKLGATHFDMWGSLPQDYDQSHPWAGFTRFKEGYGTEFVEMIGSYDLVISKGLYRLYNALFKAREKYLEFRSG